MDKINKALLKLSDKQRTKLMDAYGRVLAEQVDGLDLKKLKGNSNVYRLRVGDSRLIFQQLLDGERIILYVGKRDDKTYRDF
ncbi:MAG: type II toxin-antitoxin system RelE/ParE family toxin [Patescibacteria group bacterium]